jgi:hypothetical protein
MSASLQLIDNKTEEEIIANECPICYDEIDILINCVTTECGHRFHCKCLMQNSATNGFSCPMCRAIMATEPELSDSEADDFEEDDFEENNIEGFGDNALTSFRMFHQMLNGEDIEEEEEEECEYDEPEVDEEEDEPKPSAEFIATKLSEQGITLEDLVKCLLMEHVEYEADEETNDRYSDQMFGKFRQIISNYPRHMFEQATRSNTAISATTSVINATTSVISATTEQRHQSSRLRPRHEDENMYCCLYNEDEEDEDE